MKKLRLLLFEQCLRACPGCCNKDWDLKSLPVAESFNEYDIIILTGGEPLMRPAIVVRTIRYIRNETQAPVFVYTAETRDVGGFLDVLKAADGMTVTLHEQCDVQSFENLCSWLVPSNIQGKSMRLNIFKGINCPVIPAYWQVKKDMEWMKNCPLPQDEVFKRLPLGTFV